MVRYSDPANPQRESRLLRLATDFWFAVQRMARRGEAPPNDLVDYYPPDDQGLDGSSSSRVPRRPAPSAGSASLAVEEPEDGQSLTLDNR